MKRSGTVLKKTGPSRPRGSGSLQPTARQLEPNFRLLYKGENFDGWESSIWRIAPAVKGVSKAGPRETLCPPATVAHKAGIELVSNPVDGHLRTVRLYRVTSFKFDYMIAPLAQEPQAKPKKGAVTKSGRNTSSSPIRRPHVSTTLYLDQPLKIGNTAQCIAITCYLAPSNIGKAMTLGHGNKDESFYDPTAKAGYPRGQWNEMEVRCGEKEIQFLVNGVEINRLETSRRINGKVGFSFDGQEVHFANIRLSEGSASAFRE